MGLIFVIPTLFIDMIIFSIWTTLIWLFFSWYMSYVAISRFDKEEKSRSNRIRWMLWIEPSRELAKYEIFYTKYQDVLKLLTDSISFDGHFNFHDNKEAFAKNLVITSHWTKGSIGWRKKGKLLIPLQYVAKIAERH